MPRSMRSKHAQVVVKAEHSAGTIVRTLSSTLNHRVKSPMEQQAGGSPTAEDLQAFSLGKCQPQRAGEIEAFLADGPDQTAILEAAEGPLLRHLRGAGELLGTEGPLPFTGPLQPPSVRDGLGAEAGPLFGHPRYRLIRKLGEGGMGTVYLAEHRLLRRLVAVKLIRAGRLRSSHLVARFRQEMQTAARLAHPHLVVAHDADVAGDTPFLVMEYIEGNPWTGA